MSTTGPTDYRALLKRAYTRLDGLQEKLAAAERAAREPIAVVGLGLRFPGGATDAASFWRLLHDGVDPVTEVPGDRFDLDEHYDPDPDAPGKTYARWGGFVDDVDRFDPHFFGIAPREAHAMDPQQRILLEATWEALEDAGYASPALAGRSVGVYVGMVAVEYAQLSLGELRMLDTYFGAGVSRSIAAGRISYNLGLMGPNLIVDTACSSSLVAVHLACRSLRARESDMALAGGVNLMLAPDGFISTSRARMASFTGRCRAFDAGADGYVRADGCAMIVLKRLADAVADRDAVLGVILGSAVNQDGRSNGITAPNGKAQEAVIRAAIADAGIEPGDISLVEAHGTGTPLGDPIEIRALANVFGGSHSPESPLLVGSVKTNIGHTEATAGIASLVKVLLALRHRTIPPHLHLREPNPRIPWDEVPIAVPTSATPWEPAGGRRRVAGVSSYGFSGTNSHVIVAEPEPEPTPEAAPSGAVAPAQASGPAAGTGLPDRGVHLLPLSARSEPALRQLAARYRDRLADTDAPLPDIAFTAGVGRTHFAERLAVVADSTATARERLAAWLDGGEPAGVRRGTAPGGDPPEVAFLFTGQGAQYVSMGRGLYETSPVFRRALDRCDEVLREHLDVPLLDVIYPRAGGTNAGLLDRTEYTQPALFAVEWALAELWRSWGVEPAAVLGHSIGEYVAACVAGMLGLEDGCRLVAARGRLMGALPAGGVMAAVFAPEDVVQEAIVGHTHAVAIAAVNGPTSLVVSGAADAMEAVLAGLTGAGVRTRPLTVSHAFHSPLMDPVLDEFEAVAASLDLRPPRLPVISNVTGRVGGAEMLTARYWRDHVRSPVRYADGVMALWQQGLRVFVEAGPGPTLIGMARHFAPQDPGAAWVPSLRPDRDDWPEILGGVAELYARGVELDWAGLDRGRARRRVRLPTYPFQRQRYWADFPSRDDVRRPAGVHPLLGQRVSSPLLDATVFQCDVGVASPAFLGDHTIHDAVLFPATGFLEMGMAAARQALGPGAHTLADVTVHDALVLPGTGGRTLQVAIAGDTGERTFRVFGRAGGPTPEDGDGWRLHASGRVVAAGDEAPGHETAADAPAEAPGTGSSAALEAARERCTEEVPLDDFYAGLVEAGVAYGPAFRTLERVWRRDGEAVARIGEADDAGADDGWLLHPALLDACIQLVGAAIPGFDLAAGDGTVYVPVSLGTYRLHHPSPGPLWCRAALEARAETRDVLAADFQVWDVDGRLVAEVGGIRLQRIERDAVRRLVRAAPGAEPDLPLYQLQWQAVAEADGADGADGDGAGSPRAAAMAGTWLLVADDGGVADALAARIEAGGGTAVLVRSNEGGPDGDRLAGALDEARARGPYRGAVHLAALDDAVDAARAEPTVESLARDNRRVCGSALALVQVTARSGASGGRLLFVTRGAQAVTGEEAGVAVAQSPLWGLVRTVQLEHPDLGAACLDLDPDADPTDDAALSATVAELVGDGEDQVARRAAQRYAARLARHGEPAGALRLPDGPYEIGVSERGVLDNLVARPAERRAPGPGEVEVEVRATGLNFRDVLNVLGMVPGDPRPIGGECAGVVRAVGEGVEGLAEGDAVMALGAGAFRSHLVTAARGVYRVPAGLGFEEAATLPIAFLTAYHGLHHLARVRPGDRVLVHAAAGGVGLAAVQLALRAGARVFGTAGTPRKRAFLRAMGVHHTFSSRTPDFAAEILELTGGAGVDIVLNSLADDFIPRSLEVLADRGRFLEIGKRGTWTAEQVAELNPTLEYHVYDLATVLAAEPGLAAAMLDRLVPDIEAGTLRPLPVRVFPARRTVDAFRFMAQARHIGKIVVAAAGDAAGAVIRDDAAYLVTGGLGGLGLVVARWLADRGARHLALMGRGEPGPAAADAIAELAARGVTVEVARGDVGSRQDVDRVLARLRDAMPPVRGVVHAAGVNDDATLLQQDWPRFERVARPKMLGAWNLHEATRDLPLDFFVLFSAGSAILGAAGQGNYSAANAFLDALAHHRRARGLPALSVDWGAWAGAGMVAATSRQDRQRWAGYGIGLIEPDEGVEILERLLHGDLPQVAALPIDWRRFLAQPGMSGRPLLRLLRDQASTTGGRHANAGGPGRRGGAAESAAQGAFARELEAADPLERYERLMEHVRGRVVRVLGLDPGAPLDGLQGLTDIGMDSLMAVELSNHLQASLGRKLPPTLAFEYPTLTALTDYLATEVLGLNGADGGNGTEPGTRTVPEPAPGIAPESVPEPEPAATMAGQDPADETETEETEEELLRELRRAGY